MAETSPGVRLRQAVLVAKELEPLARRLRLELGLDEPFRDPCVGEFGLANVVFAIGDCFLVIVSPLTAGTGAAPRGAAPRPRRGGGGAGQHRVRDRRLLP